MPTHYAITRYVGHKGQIVSNEDEMYIDGELQPLMSGDNWKYYSVAEISFFCREHREQEIQRDKPCSVCGRVVADI